MRKWYEKYKNWVVVSLFILLCFKGCQSCSRSRVIEWNKNIYESNIDSLTNVIDLKSDSLQMFADSIHMYKFMMDRVERDNKWLIEANRQIQRNNTTLINTNNQIVNKDKENEKSE